MRRRSVMGACVWKKGNEAKEGEREIYRLISLKEGAACSPPNLA